ncbi:MAG: 4-alpha-glucanotransferase [Bacteroidota bacterium]|nr:4-alpha-glucanotransferase [Bacteroidota bacterium]
MTINFYLKYRTVFGEDIFISGNNQYLGDNDSSKAVALSWFNEEFWHGSLELPDDFDDTIIYKYILKDKNGLEIFDGEENRSIDLSVYKNKSFTITDTWNSAGNIGNVFFTRAFSKILLPPVTKTKISKLKKFTHEFRVKAPLLQPGETIFLCGSTKNLKNWDTENPVLLYPKNNWFVANICLEENEWPATYKYGIYNLNEKKVVRYEDGENRSLQKNDNEDALIILHDGFVNYPQKLWKGAGVSIPVFGLRSRKSFGVGEFSDIKLLIDWAKKTGLQLIQLLPVNDTTAHHNWHDSYPYAAISAFALHPLYINLEKVAGKKFNSIVKPLKRKQKQLNDLAEFDYEQVMKFKLSALKELYLACKNEFKNDLNYFEFFELNRHWLVPYAAFSYLRDKYKTPDFTKWKTHKVYNESAIQKFVAPSKSYYDGIAFFYFVQYHLHLQMKEVADYAHQQHIILKGDIPIGVYRYGCDAWMNPSLYNLDEQAGAPPDDFAVKGQNWGFPTYNWEKMKLDNFEWWRRRFDQMSNYFDAFRIDHILGFFRIWSIPMNAVEGILGRFSPAIPVDISEFHNYHIWFDRDRYCKPFITDEILQNIFHEKAEEVKDTFLDLSNSGYYHLKEEVNTQAKVAEYFSNEKQKKSIIKQGLFDLISNVILLEEKNSKDQKFHFRIAMDRTSSFAHLDQHTQRQLEELYINYFYRRQDNFWKKEAMKKLPQLKRTTNMLICGEDLGMVPHCVPEVMNNLGILGLEIERMPKDTGTEFFHPKDALYLSIVTPSTHDMSTIRGWWEEDYDKTQHFYNYMLGHYGEAPHECEGWINKEIILQHLYSPAMWSIFQLSDLLGMDEQLRRENPHDERINIPADSDHYWHYRIHLNMENLLKQNDFNEELLNYITDSDRNS